MEDEQKIINRIEEAARSSGVLPDRIDKAIAIASPAFRIDSLGGVFTREYQSPEDYLSSGSFRADNAHLFSKGGTIKRSEFDQMSQSQRSVHMRAGGKVVD